MPYRSADAALADRERSIERELQQLLGPTGGGGGDPGRAAALEAELDLVREALASRNPEQRRKRLPIRLQMKCAADWERMRGADRVRACYDCGHRVYDFSGLTSEEAYELLSHYERRLGKRLYRRADGTVLAEPCPGRWRSTLGHRSVLPVLLTLIAIMAPIVVWKAQSRFFKMYSDTSSFRSVLDENQAAQASRSILDQLHALPRQAWWHSPKPPPRRDAQPQSKRHKVVCGTPQLRRLRRQ